MKIKPEYEMATDILEDIWLHIDWGEMSPIRRMKFYDEMMGQVKGLSKCYNDIEKFLDKVCSRLGSYLFKNQTRELLKADEEIKNKIMNIYRNETQIPFLLLRLRREEAKKQFSLKNEEKNEEI